MNKIHKTIISHIRESIRDDEEFVAFMVNNVKTHPGTTELIISVRDEELNMGVRLKTQNRKIEVNDELIRYLQEHEEQIKYNLDKA